jgi:hypothetical protein
MEGVLLSGKMDTRLVNQLTGGRQPMDHKTVGSFNDMRQNLPMNEQFLTYMLLDHLTKEEHERVDGVTANMLRRVKRTVTAKPPFYDRVTVNHGMTALRSFYHRLTGTIQDLKRTEERLGSGENPLRVCPPTPDRSCSWQCSFYRVCYMIDSSPEAAEVKLATEFEEHDPYERYLVKVMEHAEGDDA